MDFFNSFGHCNGRRMDSEIRISQLYRFKPDSRQFHSEAVHTFYNGFFFFLLKEKITKRALLGLALLLAGIVVVIIFGL